jgi:hypothetical protein
LSRFGQYLFLLTAKGDSYLFGLVQLRDHPLMSYRRGTELASSVDT